MMRFNNYLEECRNDDVLCHKADLFTVGKFKTAIVNIFKSVIPNKLQEELAKQNLPIQATKLIEDNRTKRLINKVDNNVWFEEGVSFEILRAGSPGWQKGKMRINVTLEFIPDEPEEKSPLDDVRQELEQNNS